MTKEGFQVWNHMNKEFWTKRFSRFVRREKEEYHTRREYRFFVMLKDKDIERRDVTRYNYNTLGLWLGHVSSNKQRLFVGMRFGGCFWEHNTGTPFGATCLYTNVTGDDVVDITDWFLEDFNKIGFCVLGDHKYKKKGKTLKICTRCGKTLKRKTVTYTRKEWHPVEPKYLVSGVTLKGNYRVTSGKLPDKGEIGKMSKRFKIVVKGEDK